MPTTHTIMYHKLVAVFSDGKEVILATSRWPQPLEKKLQCCQQNNLYPGRKVTYEIKLVVEKCRK